jgi:hypothetical protein
MFRLWLNRSSSSVVGHNVKTEPYSSSSNSSVLFLVEVTQALLQRSVAYLLLKLGQTLEITEFLIGA